MNRYVVRLRLAAIAGLLLVLAAAGLACGCAEEHEPAYYVQQLGDPKEEVRDRAKEQLKKLQEQAIAPVRAGLASDSEEARKGCLDVLASVRRMDSLTLAGQMLDDPATAVRVKAVETVSTLSSVWKDKSVELLAQALSQDEPEVVWKAAEGLKNMRYEGATAALRRKFEEPKGMQPVYAARRLYELEPDPAVARRLLQSLLARQEAVRTAAGHSILGVRKAGGNLDPKGLQDQIIGPLVRFADSHPQARSVQELVAEVRDELIKELSEILDTKRAAVILDALAEIADRPSVEKIITDMDDDRLGSTWRVAAASSLGKAARSPRISPSLEQRAVEALSETLADQGTDNRVRIAASISLCRLEQRNGVTFLLNELDRYQETVSAEEELSEAELDSLTELRIRAQEALTASGDFVVGFLRRKVAEPDAGPIILWAAAKTFGDLRVGDAVPFLKRCLAERASPQVAVRADGTLSAPVVLQEPDDPDEARVAELTDEMEMYSYPDYVRWTAAAALGRIGTEQALAALREVEQQERGFLDRLQQNAARPDFHLRAPVISKVMRRHEDVLFYIRLALGRVAED